MLCDFIAALRVATDARRGRSSLAQVVVSTWFEEVRDALREMTELYSEIVGNSDMPGISEHARASISRTALQTMLGELGVHQVVVSLVTIPFLPDVIELAQVSQYPQLLMICHTYIRP